MALDAGTVSNLATSKIAPVERFLKLYRKLHDLFLQSDFTNRKDHETAVKQINIRIDTLERNINSTLSQITASLSNILIHANTHIHPGLGLSPGVPPLVITPSVILVPSPPAITTKSFALARNNLLQATGEPVVPINTTAPTL